MWSTAVPLASLPLFIAAMSTFSKSRIMPLLNSFRSDIAMSCYASMPMPYNHFGESTNLLWSLQEKLYWQPSTVEPLVAIDLPLQSETELNNSWNCQTQTEIRAHKAGRQGLKDKWAQHRQTPAGWSRFVRGQWSSHPSLDAHFDASEQTQGSHSLTFDWLPLFPQWNALRIKGRSWSTKKKVYKLNVIDFFFLSQPWAASVGTLSHPDICQRL